MEHETLGFANFEMSTNTTNFKQTKTKAGGESGENSPVCPGREVLRNFFSFQSDWNCEVTGTNEVQIKPQAWK